MVAHEKRNSAQLFCAVPTRNELALSSLLFSAQPTQKLGYPEEGREKLNIFPLFRCAEREIVVQWHQCTLKENSHGSL